MIMVARSSRQIINRCMKLVGFPFRSVQSCAPRRSYSTVLSAAGASQTNDVFNRLYQQKLNLSTQEQTARKTTVDAHQDTLENFYGNSNTNGSTKCKRRMEWTESIISQHVNVQNVRVIGVTYQDIFNANFVSHFKHQFAFVQLTDAVEQDISQTVEQLTAMCSDMGIDIRVMVMDRVNDKSMQELIDRAVAEFREECIDA